jgi:hypothetical protein
LTNTGAGQTLIPLRASEHAKVTVTAELFQPAAFAGGLADALIAGTVLSRLIVTDVVVEFPALSVAVPDTT